MGLRGVYRLWLVWLTCSSWMTGGQTQADEPWQPIFDGRTLDGWAAGDASYWSIEQGAITGRITSEHPCSINQYLIWQGGEFADFELKLRSRLNGEGGINNGFQFRSRRLPDGDVCGYQMDNNLQTPWLVRLYDEYGRHTLALRGERRVFGVAGERQTEPLAEAGGEPWFRLEDWHEYHLICSGGQLQLHVDGRLAAEVQDDDLRRRDLQGILALQLHSGPPTVVQFQDIRVKVLRPAVPADTQNVAATELPGALREQLVARWHLDTGGHGATPALRHVPAFEQLELNVRPVGQNAPTGRVVKLDGAYFEAQAGLLAGSQWTVHLRAADPSGQWRGALCAIGSEGAGSYFELRSFAEPDGDGENGTRLMARLRTDRGETSASVPLAQIDASAWHDLVVRYSDGKLGLFCDGRLLSERHCPGALSAAEAPLMLAARRAADGSVSDAFRGEMQLAAIWQRGLSDAEIQRLRE